MNMPWKSPPPALSRLTIQAGSAIAANANPNAYAGNIVDELGAVRAEIKRLKEREESLAERVEALGPGDHDGTKCRAVVSVVTTNRLDTKSLTAVLPEALVAAHTKASQSVRVSIKALV